MTSGHRLLLDTDRVVNVFFRVTFLRPLLISNQASFNVGYQTVALATRALTNLQERGFFFSGFNHTG